tara:strand:+ start:3999 stop:4508 length:510 start_codon:yes stop_codon:yes gene_type:complete
MALIQEVRGIQPKISDGVFLAQDATILGDVEIGSQSSIWFKSVIRGDVNSIRIGSEVNVQDSCILHATFEHSKTIVEDRVSIGHGVILHGCHICSHTLIGMGSIIMDLAVIPKNCIVGAGSLVTERASFPEGHLILGSPAKAVRPLKPEEIEHIQKSVENYKNYVSWYQ